MTIPYPSEILRRSAAVFIISCAMSSCADDAATHFLLTTQVNALAQTLYEFDDCADKSNYIQKWIQIRESSLIEQRIEFDRECAPGKSQYIRCRAAHILASAAVENAISDCAPAQDLREQVSRLNEIASTAARIGEDVK